MGYKENLENITPFIYNDSLTGDTEELLPNMIDNANDQTGNLWYYGMMLSIYLLLVFFFFKKEDRIRLDMLRSIFVAAGWCIILSGSLVLSQVATSILPTMWFVIIWFISRVAIWGLEKKNQ